MHKRPWIIAVALLGSLGFAAFAVFLRRDHSPVQAAPPTIEPLADRQDLVGEWNRVEFPEAVVPVNWRKFSATGEMEVCYGDVIHWGTYSFIGDTVETRDGNDGAVNRWTVGRADHKL